MIPIFFWILLVLFAINAVAPISPATYRDRIGAILIVLLFLLVGLSIYQNPLR